MLTRMGLMDRVAARARLAADQAKQAAQELDARLSEDPDYAAARAAAVEGTEKGRAALDRARVAAEGLLEEASRSETGARIGDKARNAATVLAQLPVLSAMTDAAKARHGVSELHGRLVEDPTDPFNALWLAEALDRVEQDLGRYRRVRSMTSATYSIRRAAILGALALGAESQDPTRLHLLKSAFARSLRAVRSDPRDVDALHCLARVYLAQAMTGPAISCIKRALVLRPDDALLWITLARCYLAATWHTSAAEAAQRAVALGGSYAHEVLAMLSLLGDAASDVDEAVATYERHKEAITPAGRAAYLGCSTDGRQALQALKAEQARRGTEALDWIKGL